MKNIKRNFAIAAALVIASAVLLIIIFNKPEPEIKINIPPELASMSLEELIKLHYNPGDSDYDPNIITAALQQALDKTKPEQVIQIAKGLVPKGGMRGQGQRAAPPVHPISHLGYTGTTFHDVVEKSDIFVHANLRDIKINVEDIIKGLIEKEEFSHFEDFTTHYRVSLTLTIIETLPKDVLKRGKTITIPVVIDEEKLNVLKKNSGYYFCMTLDKTNEPHFLDYFSGVYAVDFNSPANMEFWQFLTDTQDMLKYGKIPEQKTIDYWSSRLKDDTFLLALEYMDILPDDLIPADAIMDAFEIRYNELLGQVQQGYDELVKNGQAEFPAVVDSQIRKITSNSMDLFDKIVELLLRADDKKCINRMLVLFEKDIDYSDRSVLWRRFNNRYDSKMKYLIVRLIEASQGDVLSERLKDIYANNKDASWRDIYATRIYPYSRPTSSSEYTKLETLFESGQQEEAVSQALETLAQPVREERSYDLFRDLYRNGELLLILGKAEGEDILKVINEFTEQEYIDHYLKVYEKLGESRSGDWRMSTFLQNGIMALGRFGGKSAIPKLRQFYNSGNIRIKIVSAVALYYNGDMTGEVLVRKFVEGTQLQDPEIALRWGQDMSDGTVFQDIISSYLRNDLTDALLLEKMSNYLDRADTNVESDFFKAHKPEVLQIAVKHLNNKNRAIRGNAVTILRNATGQNFGFDPDRYHGRQDEVIQKWKDYLDQANQSPVLH